MVRRVPTSLDRHISSWMPSCPRCAMAQCSHSEDETTLYWHWAADILIQELKDYRDHWFSILGKRQEASHHSSSTMDANGLFKMLPRRSPLEPICFCHCRAVRKILKSPAPISDMSEFISTGWDVLALSSIITQHLSAIGNIWSLKSHIWPKNENRVANNGIKLLSPFMPVDL